MRIIDRLRIFFDIDYSSNKEYWIPINEIKIREEFLATPPITENSGRKKIHSSSMVNWGRL